MKYLLLKVPKDGHLEDKARNSNLELLRIISMILIIAHHYVVNSGVMEQYDFFNITPNMIYLQLFGMWGKTAINVFILISGFFLCEMRLKWQRWLKIFAEWEVYRAIIFIILVFLGYEQISAINLLKIIVEIPRFINNGFVASFLFFYLFVPYYNLLIKKMNRRNHLMLITILVMIFSVFGTFLKAEYCFSETTWYITIYFVAAYIKLYPTKCLENLKICVICLCLCLFGAILGFAFLELISIWRLKDCSYYLVSDSNKILAFGVALFAFLTFKNMRVRYSHFINATASTVFGVLCIHASSDAMRTFLWRDLVNVPNAYYYPIWKLVVTSVIVVITIFVVCAAIDYLRIRFIEKPLFVWLNKQSSEWKETDSNLIKRLCAL